MAPRVDGTNQVSGHTAELTLDDQMSDILNNPRLSEHQKADELQKSFQGLSDAEKSELYDRLKTKNPKDQLSRLFHYRFSHGPGGGVDRTLNALRPSSSSTAQGGGGGTPIANDTRSKTAKAGENKVQADARQVDLQQQLRQNQMIDGLKNTLKGPGDAKTKMEAIRNTLGGVTADDLKAVLNQSESWPADQKRIINGAIGGSVSIMERIARGFSPDEQVKAIGRTLESDIASPDSPALRAWMGATSAAALNKAVSGPDGGTLQSAILHQIQQGDYGAFADLNGKNKENVVKYGAMLNQDLSGLFKSNLAFPDPSEKGPLFYTMQHDGQDGMRARNFLAQAAPHIDKNFLEGFSEGSVEQMRRTLVDLAESAKKNGQKDLAILYFEKANYLEQYKQDTFSH